MMDDLRRAFAGASVFVTGHTGFKGSWLCMWLDMLGARVTGFALPPPTEPSNFVEADVASTLVRHCVGDVNDAGVLTAALADAAPDVVLHMAAQTTVLDGYARPRETFATNVMGTVNVLEAVRDLGRSCAVVVVTSDKCYRNNERDVAFDEDDPLGGDDPYSASKAGAEIVTESYRRSFFPAESLDDHGVALASARAGNVIGGGDWTPHGLIADAVRGLWSERTIDLRYPHAVRPWQHVLEPLGGYLRLAAALRSDDASKYQGAYNFGPDGAGHATVSEVVDAFLEAYGRGRSLVRRGAGGVYEASTLRLATGRAARDLGWSTRWDLSTAIDRTARWFRDYEQEPASARDACLRDLTEYVGA